MSEAPSEVVTEAVPVDPEFADLKLIPFDDPRLVTPCTVFDFEKDGARAPLLAKALLDRMFEWKGVGLSANQVGLDYNVFVMGTETTHFAVFNPQLVQVSEETELFREGCMSFPGLWLTLRRPKSCVISYQDKDGNKVVQEFPGMAARIALHELDHVNGIVFTMRASKFKVDWELKKLFKATKKLVRQQQQRSTRGKSSNGT